MFLKILFVLLILIFPLGEVFRFTYSNSIVFRLNDFFVGLTVLTWFIFSFLRNRKINSSLTKPIIFFAGACLLSLLLNLTSLSLSQASVAFLYLLRWIFYTALYFVVLDFDPKFRKKMLSLIVFSGFLFVAIGYFQYFFYSNLRNLFYLGWDDHLYRMFGSVLDPNFAGAIFVLYLLLFVALLIYKLQNKDKKSTLLLIILSFAALGAVYLTYSRSAFIMLITGTFILFLLLKQLKLMLIILTISFFVFLISSKNFYIENINLFRTASTEARVDSMQNAFRIIGDHPVFGVGFNAYRYAQIKYGFREGIGAEISHADAGTDNSYLFVFATSGLLGLIAFLYLLKSIYQKNMAEYKKGKGIDRILTVVFIASITGVIVNSLFINSLFYPFIMEWLWIMFGVVSITNNNLKKNN